MILIVAAAEMVAAEEIAESDFEGEKPWLTPREGRTRKGFSSSNIAGEERERELQREYFVYLLTGP